MNLKKQITLLRILEVVLYILILLSFSVVCFGHPTKSEIINNEIINQTPTPNFDQDLFIPSNNLIEYTFKFQIIAIKHLNNEVNVPGNAEIIQRAFIQWSENTKIIDKQKNTKQFSFDVIKPRPFYI